MNKTKSTTAMVNIFQSQLFPLFSFAKPNPRRSWRLVGHRAVALGTLGYRASGALTKVTGRSLRRLSSDNSPFPNDGDRAEYLGYTLGLRQGAYLALVSGGGINAAAATLIPRGSCDALFLLAYDYAPVPGHPEGELQDRFFLGLAHGRRHAEAFFGSTSPSSYPNAWELATAALLSYHRAFRWSQTQGTPLASPEDISPETLVKLASEVRQEFRDYHSEEVPALANLEGFLREGLELFALANPFLVALPLPRRFGKTYSLFNSSFALMYRYLESAPPD